jgi:hypothetical protein
MLVTFGEHYWSIGSSRQGSLRIAKLFPKIREREWAVSLFLPPPIDIYFGLVA